MSATVSAFGHRGTTSSVKTEIVRELVNASDGAGLHFNGSGVVAFTPVDLGSKFSHEFVLSTSEDLTTGTSSYIIDYHGSSDRFIIGAHPTQSSGNLAIYDNTDWVSFGVNPLTDLKVHHIVVTVDGTSAVLYDNGNQVATATISASHGIDSTTNAGLAGYYNNSNNFEGTIYRARSYNKTLTSAEVQTAFERADVSVADQYGSQTDLTSGSFAGFGSFGTGVSESGGVLTATGGATGNIASKAISLVPNAVYRVQYEILTISGGSGVAINPSGTGGLTPTRTATGVYTETMTTPSDATGTINVYTSSSMGAFNGTLGNITVQRIGCVSDYDLAFANPTQSTTVQDRAGAADGTCSSSGVTQVQPVLQLNTEQLSVGGTNAKVGIGLGAGSSPQEMLHISGISPRIRLRDSDATGTPISTIDASGGDILISADANNETAGSDIRLATDGTTHFTLDASGNVLIGSGTPASLVSGGDSPVLAIGGTAALGDGDKATAISFLTSDSSYTGTYSDGICGEITSVSESDTGAAYGLAFHTGTTTGSNRAERMRISSTGNVGIGDSPSTLLHLKSANPVIRLEDSDPDGVYAEIDGAGGDLILSADGGNGDSSSSIKFKVDNTTRAVIDNSSNLFLGVTSNNTSKTNKLVFRQYATSAEGEGYVAMLNNATSGNNNLNIGGGSGSHNAATEIEFYTAADETTRTGTARLTIDSTGLASFSNGVTVSGGVTSIGSSTELTVSGNAVTVTNSFHTIDTQNDDPTDSLSTINGGVDGAILVLRSENSLRDTNIEDGTGNLRLAGDFNLLSTQKMLTLIKAGSNWYELSRSDNG